MTEYSAQSRNLKTNHLFDISINVETRQLGDTPHGLGIFDQITGGSFEGSKLSGNVLPAGSGFAIRRKDGAFENHIQLLLQTRDQVILRMKYNYLFSASDEVLGRIFSGQAVEPSEYYFRSQIVFDAPLSSPYAYLNTLVAIGVGQVVPGATSVRYAVHAVG